MSPSRQQVTDPGHERRYFTMVPHLVTDMVGQGLTPTAFAMYVYLRRMCGENGGEFAGDEATTRAIAARLGISVGSAHTCRGMLVEYELIDLHLEGPEGHEQAHITIRDVWPENMATYGAKAGREGLRSNIERKSRRQPRLASGGAFKVASGNSGVSVQASVQHLNAPIPSPEKPEERKNVEEPEERTTPENDDSADKETDEQLAFLIQPLAREFDDPAIASCVSQARNLWNRHRDALGDFGRFAGAIKAAAHETRKRVADQSRQRLGTPMAYFFHELQAETARRTTTET